MGTGRMANRRLVTREKIMTLCYIHRRIPFAFLEKEKRKFSMNKTICSSSGVIPELILNEEGSTVP